MGDHADALGSHSSACGCWRQLCGRPGYDVYARVVLHASVCAPIMNVCLLTAGAGDASLKEGIAIHVYSCNASMGKTVFYNSDGDYLIGV